jgi:Mechanosensitive ion channel
MEKAGSQTLPDATVDYSRKDVSNDSDDNDPLVYDEYDRLHISATDAPSQQHQEYGTMAEAFTNARKKRTQRRPLLQLQQTLSPSNVLAFLLYVTWNSAIVWVGVPASILSWILFYSVGDPELDFLPGQIPLSWWMDFVSRQTVTLDAARCLEYLLLHMIIGSSTTAMKILGPGICQYCIKSNGWPAVAVGWSFLDMIVLHGDDKFVKHWLYWTGLRIYDLNTSINGNNFIGSVLYLRLLIATMIAGLATSLKRFLLDLQFKQRQCIAFKSRLEKLLLEMILVADIAFLADHAPIIQTMSQEGGTTETFDLHSKSVAKSKMSEHISFDLTNINVPIDEHDTSDELFGSNCTQNLPFRAQTMSLSSSGLFIKDLLDVWEPPENKSDKNIVSVRDVLRFQSALGFINADDPFGESFGSTLDRDSCIQSAMQVYSKLSLLNSPEDKVLNFDVLLLAIYDDEGKVDSAKKKSLVRLFRPDAKNHVTELAFVQSCDAVYKRLRYFQASVGNASVIDNVLAGIVDAFFYFVLALVILSLLEINPWTLLVSITSLLVSISFALGPSVSKYVEGVLLIAVRRPFDLGDRIYIGPPDTTSTASPGGNVDMSSCTWFVEDINLSTTTLRFARTNEVSTMNNWAIAGSKIINCNRSPGALVVLNLILHVSIFEKTTLDEFQAELQQYVMTHPRIWDSLVFCRHDSVDADLEQVSFQYAFSRFFFLFSAQQMRSLPYQTCPFFSLLL